MPVIARLRRSGRPRPRRRRRLRTISTLPTLLTLGNLLCGFAAAYFCMRALTGADELLLASEKTTLLSRLQERMLPSFLSIAAFLVFLGLMFDALDGSVARLTKRMTDFGGQLDSLSDVVTFGVVPALLVVAVLLSRPDLANEAGPLSSSLAGRAMWMMAAVYVACAALRLARFNVEHAQSEPTHTKFSGLPTPGAALVIASLVLLHEHVSESARMYIAWPLPFIALGLGLLMVSRVRYVHLANTYLRSRRPFGQVVAMLIVLAVFWWYKEMTLAVVVCAYALSGPVAALHRRLRPHEQPARQQAPKAGQPARKQSANKSGQRSA